MVFADSHQISRIRCYLGTPNGVFVSFAYGAITLCGATFQNASARHQLCNSVESLVPLLSGPTTPNWQRHQALPPARFRLIPFRSPLLRESLLLSFPPGTEMFQFPGFALHAYGFSMQYGRSRGFPHSDTSGSELVCQLPEDFAGYRVLHRLLPPRHPPRTLIRLTI